jgi:nitroreductase
MKLNEEMALTGDFRKTYVTEVIRNRRSTYADEFMKKELPDELLQEVLTNATWAPTHKMTEPWRFIVFKGVRLVEYGAFMADYYRDYYQKKLCADDLQRKLLYLRDYPKNAACLIGIVLAKSYRPDLPEWEEIAAVASAVQNMAITCAAHGIGNYWSTVDAAIAYVAKQGLDPNEQALGLLYMGYCPPGYKGATKRRTDINQKVSYLQ